MPAEPNPGERDGEGPPFWSWSAIYLVVLGALAVEIVLAAAFSAGFR
jgi:hypothetical protein